MLEQIEKLSRYRTIEQGLDMLDTLDMLDMLDMLNSFLIAICGRESDHIRY